MHLFLVLLNITVLAGYSFAFNVLAVFMIPYKSHYIGPEKLLNSLAADGHQVTLISPFPQTDPLPNFIHVTLTGIEEAIHDFASPYLAKETPFNYKRLNFLHELGCFITNLVLTHQVMVEFLAREDHYYDVVIFEAINNAATIGLGHHFNAPVIGFTSMFATLFNMDMVGTPAPVSFVPHELMLFSDRMSFVQRLENTLITAYERYKFNDILKRQDETYQKVFTTKNKPTIFELHRSVSLVLVNQHFSFDHPQPYATNMIDIGGIHINTDLPKQLPKEILQFVEKSANGVIYFSMGSIVKSSNLPIAMRDGLLSAFGKLKERVLWKWEDPDLPGKPANVMIRNWFPQEDILAHPNVKLFISHGGLLSVMETVYHAVPIIGIPIFGDHFVNMFRAQSAGYGLTVAFANITEESITWSIDEILNNDRYLLMARKMSHRFRDVPIKPLELAKYWVNYVVRHKGAPQLRSAGQDLSFLAYHNLDVFAVLATVATCIIVLFLICTRMILRRVVFLQHRPSKLKKGN